LCWHRGEILISYPAMTKFRNALLIAAVLLAAMTFSAGAQQTKIATVDVKKLFNAYYKTKLAQASLENRKAELNKEIKEMIADLKKAETEYKQLLEQASDQGISADEREKRKQAATDKSKEIANARGAIEQFQRQGEAQLNDQLTRMSSNVIAEIQKAVAEKAKVGGYTIVLNVNLVDAVVYANPDCDITASVLAQLNAGAPIDVSTPTNTGAPLNLSTNAP
jgi:Skp family chaperone for outer membrane proteins